jgi:hypothetical protein
MQYLHIQSQDSYSLEAVDAGEQAQGDGYLDGSSPYQLGDQRTTVLQSLFHRAGGRDSVFRS